MLAPPSIRLKQGNRHVLNSGLNSEAHEHGARITLFMWGRQIETDYTGWRKLSLKEELIKYGLLTSGPPIKPLNQCGLADAQ